MSTTWITVNKDASKEDQVTTTYNPDDGSVVSQVIQTWYCVAQAPTDGTSPANVSNPVEAQFASAGGNTIPAVGGTLTYTVGESTADYTVTQVFPKRTGPIKFNVQVTGQWKYMPTPANPKSNITIRISGQQYTQQAYFDKDNKPVQNSANQSFDPSLNMVLYDERIEVNYNCTSDQSATFASIRGMVNSASISFAINGISRTFAERALLCEDITQTDTLPLGDGTPTYKVTASFLARADTWIDVLLDQGYYWVDEDCVYHPFLDSQGKPVTQPVRLDGSGNPLGCGDDPVYITFKIQGEADFTSAFSGLS